MLLFDSCLIPVVWFPIRVGWFPNHPFWDSETSLVSRWHATEVVLHWCLQSVFMFCFCIFWGNGILPATQELGVLGLWDAEHVDIPGQNPENVWVTGAHSVNWQRPGSWEAQEIGRQLLNMNKGCWYFLRSPVAALALCLQSSHVERLLVWRFLSQNLDSEVSFCKSQSAASTQHCATNTTINLRTEEEKFQT